MVDPATNCKYQMVNCKYQMVKAPVIAGPKGIVSLLRFFLQYAIILIVVIVLEIVAGVLGFVFQGVLVSVDSCSRVLT